MALAVVLLALLASPGNAWNPELRRKMEADCVHGSMQEARVPLARAQRVCGCFVAVAESSAPESAPASLRDLDLTLLASCVRAVGIVRTEQIMGPEKRKASLKKLKAAGPKPVADDGMNLEVADAFLSSCEETAGTWALTAHKSHAYCFCVFTLFNHGYDEAQFMVASSSLSYGRLSPEERRLRLEMQACRIAVSGL